jgi:hypothetical protein
LRIRLGNILEPKKEQVTEDWRKMHNEEFHDLYCSPNTVRLMKFKNDKMAGLLAYIGAKINAYSVLVVESEGK